MGCPAKYARSSEALAQFKAAVEQGLGRACPNPLCGRRGTKDDACTHMICDLCRTKWCYVCGLDVQSVACSLGPAPRRPEDPLGNPHYRHNVGFQVNQARCPMYLEYIHEGCDATWPADGVAALDQLHRERALRALRSFYNTVGQEQYRLLVEAFPADCSAAGCGFSEEEILAVQVDAPLYRLGHGQEARAVSLPSQLRQAAREGDEATITLLLAQGVDVNGAGTVSRRTALFYAAWYNQPSTVTQLAAVPGADVNKADHEGTTPLIMAIVHGHVEVVRTLLALPSTQVNRVQPGGAIPLIHAAHNADYILEDGDGEFEAPLASRVEIINALGGVERLDPNEKTSADATTPHVVGGISALILASAAGEPPEVVRALLAVPGLDVNAATDRGHTALLMAIRHGHFTLVRLLWEVDRVDCSVTDVRGRGALALATAFGRREIASWVLMQQTISAAGHADLAQLDANGTTALHLAASGGQLDVLRLLLETCHQRGLDVGSLRDRQGHTLLTVAAAGGQAAVVSELVTLHRAIDPVVNVPDAKGRTPLVGAARRGVWPVVLALVGTAGWHGGAAGLDANAADPSSGRTALMFAASRGQVDVVRGLLQVSGIDVSVADTHGKTAEDLAIEGRELSPNRFAEIVRELRAAAETPERIVRRRVA